MDKGRKEPNYTDLGSRGRLYPYREDASSLTTKVGEDGRSDLRKNKELIQSIKEEEEIQNVEGGSQPITQFVVVNLLLLAIELIIFIRMAHVYLTIIVQIN